MTEKIKKACVNRSCGLHLIEVAVEDSVEQCAVCNGAILSRMERLIGPAIRDMPGYPFEGRFGGKSS